MAELTNLESKLAEVLGLAMAAQDATEKVKKMLGDENEQLAGTLRRMREEAAETEQRTTQLVSELNGKKTAILEQARETKKEAVEMMETYLGGEDDPLDGFEFLTMAEAGEMGHWQIVRTMGERAGREDVTQLADWVVPIQERHFRETLDGSLHLAAAEDPDEPAE